mmetsp:Transcript_58103/g.65891  ORF Transcript_58103/g.65891 Transcript_58103/m.65891 type:complete len:209 (+) Transcript_58103:174-800(+)
MTQISTFIRTEFVRIYPRTSITCTGYGRGTIITILDCTVRIGRCDNCRTQFCINSSIHLIDCPCAYKSIAGITFTDSNERSRKLWDSSITQISTLIRTEFVREDPITSTTIAWHVRRTIRAIHGCRNLDSIRMTRNDWFCWSGWWDNGRTECSINIHNGHGWCHKEIIVTNPNDGRCLTPTITITITAIISIHTISFIGTCWNPSTTL